MDAGKKQLRATLPTNNLCIRSDHCMRACVCVCMRVCVCVCVCVLMLFIEAVLIRREVYIIPAYTIKKYGSTS